MKNRMINSALQAPYKVMIVDDHKFIVELLAHRLSVESKIEVVGMANRGPAAVHIAKTEDVDIVLLDMEFDQEDGIHIARDLLGIDPNIRIIGLSMHDEDHHPVSLLEIGGVGYLSKSASGREIIEGINRVAAGDMAISPKIAVYLATRYKNPSPIEQVRELSPRELDALVEIGKGYSVEEIANRANVSEQTIRGHRSRLKEKLDVKTDVQLCFIAIKSGLIKVQDAI